MGSPEQAPQPSKSSLFLARSQLHLSNAMQILFSLSAGGFLEFKSGEFIANGITHHPSLEGAYIAQGSLFALASFLPILYGAFCAINFYFSPKARQRREDIIQKTAMKQNKVFNHVDRFRST